MAHAPRRIGGVRSGSARLRNLPFYNARGHGLCEQHNTRTHQLEHLDAGERGSAVRNDAGSVPGAWPTAAGFDADSGRQAHHRIDEA